MFSPMKTQELSPSGRPAIANQYHFFLVQRLSLRDEKNTWLPIFVIPRRTIIPLEQGLVTLYHFGRPGQGVTSFADTNASYNLFIFLLVPYWISAQFVTLWLLGR